MLSHFILLLPSHHTYPLCNHPAYGLKPLGYTSLIFCRQFSMLSHPILLLPSRHTYPLCNHPAYGLKPVGYISLIFAGNSKCCSILYSYSLLVIPTPCATTLHMACSHLDTSVSFLQAISNAVPSYTFTPLSSYLPLVQPPCIWLVASWTHQSHFCRQFPALFHLAV